MRYLLSALILTGLSGLAAEEAVPEVKPYPLTTCIVSDEPLGAMGDPVTLVFEGQTYAFCCKPCTRKFNKDPAAHAAKLAAKVAEMEAAQQAQPAPAAEPAQQ